MVRLQKPIEARKAPRQARSAATVEIILEASARILEAGGLAAFTTNLVAEKAGISIGSLYQYFPGKEALMVALLRRKRQELVTMLEEAAEAPRAGDLGTVIDAFIRAALHHQCQRPRLAASLEYAERHLPLDEETEALKARIASTVARALAAHGIPDAATAARDLAALTRGMADTAGLFGETDMASLEARIRRAVRGYLGLNPSGAADDQRSEKSKR